MYTNNNNTIQILHLTPHLGGGVGSVVINYLLEEISNKSLEHSVICLDYANKNARKKLKSNNIKFLDSLHDKPVKVLSEIKDADIVLIHWWNHPLLYDFLVRQILPPSRIIFWSHISGLHPPYIFTNKALTYPDLFVFTTPISFDSENVKNFQKHPDNFKVIWSTCGIENVKSIIPEPHESFNIGYIGTVDPGKMHPDFVKLCSRINIPDVKFIVCGGPDHKQLKQESTNLGINDKFIFTGYVSDITGYLKQMDIFGYPLSSYHYGTCDQVLAESMAAGIVPVVFSNKMESSIVKNQSTGLVVNNDDEYIRAIKSLYYNPELKKELSKNAQQYAIENFSSKVMRNNWEVTFKELLNRPKTIKKWDISHLARPILPSDVYLESLSNYGEPFKNYANAQNSKEKQLATKSIELLTQTPQWKSKTKGTPFQYLEFFKDDKILREWCKIISSSKRQKE